jgi:hypothetical protein
MSNFPLLLFSYHVNQRLISLRTMRDESFVYADGIQGVAKAVPYQAEHWLSLLDQGSTVTVTIPNANTSQVYLEELENNISGGYVAGELSS